MGFCSDETHSVPLYSPDYPSFLPTQLLLDFEVPTVFTSMYFHFCSRSLFFLLLFKFPFPNALINQDVVDVHRMCGYPEPPWKLVVAADLRDVSQLFCAPVGYLVRQGIAPGGRPVSPRTTVTPSPSPIP